ncbi:LPS O-antigen chain length determinant protein WzzB, partial [Pseudomonas aeruginosa]
GHQSLLDAPLQLDQAASIQRRVTTCGGRRKTQPTVRDGLTTTSDDPFIPALRGLQEKYALLEGLTLNLDKVAVFRQDGTIEVPDDPVRPRKGIVLILSMLAGGFLGVAVALAILMVRGGFRRTVDAA